MAKKISVFCVLFSLYFVGCYRRYPSYDYRDDANNHEDVAQDNSSAIAFEKGYASWYGPKFDGRKTANGETFDQWAMTAAHKTLPFNTRVKVVDLDTGKSVVVRINDRGPFVRGRIIDLSHKAARKLGSENKGVARVQLYFLGKKDKEKFENHPFYLQSGAFGTKSQGEAQLKKLGFKGKVISQGGYFKVWIGPFKSDKEARKFQKRLNAPSFVVKN